MEEAFNYIINNNYFLFRTDMTAGQALMDQKGFWLSHEAQVVYDTIKDQPHLYVAFDLGCSACYVGKSHQKGGRWKRYHAYHLGTLRHQLHQTLRHDDQNHKYWIDSWMVTSTLQTVNQTNWSIQLQQPIMVAFIPFSVYANANLCELTKDEIRRINKKSEALLIQYLRDMKGWHLLNIHYN